MRKTCNINCKFLEDIDLFGTEAEVYFQGRSKRSFILGKVLTIIYAILYSAFFLYKLIRMIKKVDVNFYETTTFTGEIPSLHLDNDMFYGGFGLMDVRTMTTFVDPTIYTAHARFYHQKKVGNTFDGVYDDVELEVCDPNKFGNNHKKLFNNENVNKLYCFKKMDFDIAGHSTYDIYNYFQIYFFPCHNTTENGNHCQDIRLIKALLEYTGVTVKIQDLELTPENYNNPIIPRARELTAPVMSALYQNINAYFHIISIESDTDVLGFEVLSKYDIKKAFKYDVTFIMTRQNSPTVIEDGSGYCDITIQLTEQVITIKRTYTKLIEVLGDVGGLMEFIFSFFRIISTFLSETLYEKSIVNSLFSFDLDKKFVLIKKEKNIDNINTCNQNNINFNINNNNDELKTKNLMDKEQNNLGQSDITIYTNNNNNPSNLKNNILENKSKTIVKKPLNNKRYSKTKFKTRTERKKSLEDNYKNGNIMINSEKKEIIGKLENKVVKAYDNEISESNKIIDKISFEKPLFYFCFLFIRKFKNMQNVLLDEGMKLITDELDIRNIFKNMLLIKKCNEQYILEDKLKMSEECQKKLTNINNMVHDE